MNITGDQRIIDAMRAFLNRQAFANEWFTVLRVPFDRGGGSTCLLLGKNNESDFTNTVAVIIDSDTPDNGTIPCETFMVYHPCTCPKRLVSRARNFIRTLSRWGIEFPADALSDVPYRASDDLSPMGLRYTTPLGPLGLAALRAALSTTVVEP